MTEPERADEWHRLLEASNALLGVEDSELEKIRRRVRATMIDLLAEAIEEINRLPDPSPQQDARRRADAAWWQEIIRSMSGDSLQ